MEGFDAVSKGTAGRGAIGGVYRDARLSVQQAASRRGGRTALSSADATTRNRQVSDRG